MHQENDDETSDRTIGPRARRLISHLGAHPSYATAAYNLCQEQPREHPYGRARSAVVAVDRVLMAAGLVEPAPRSNPAAAICAEAVWHTYFAAPLPSIEHTALGAFLTAKREPSTDMANPWHYVLDEDDLWSARPWEANESMRRATDFLAERAGAFVSRPEIEADVRLAAMLVTSTLILVDPGEMAEVALSTAVSIVPTDETTERAHAFLCGLEAGDFDHDRPRALEHCRRMYSAVQRMWGDRRHDDDPQSAPGSTPPRSGEQNPRRGRGGGRPRLEHAQHRVVEAVLRAAQGERMYLFEIAEASGDCLRLPLSPTQVSKALQRVPGAERGNDETGGWAQLPGPSSD